MLNKERECCAFGCEYKLDPKVRKKIEDHLDDISDLLKVALSMQYPFPEDVNFNSIIHIIISKNYPS